MNKVEFIIVYGLIVVLVLEALMETAFRICPNKTMSWSFSRIRPARLHRLRLADVLPVYRRRVFFEMFQ